MSNSDSEYYSSEGVCGHDCHQTLTKAVKPFLSFDKPVDNHAEPSDFWKNASVVVDNLLTDTIVSFNYGGGCLSDLITKISSQTFPLINEILAVGSGNGLTEAYIGYKILKAKIVHITDIKSPHDMVEELPGDEAIDKYTEADTLMFIYPYSFNSGYKEIILKFKGDYIVMIGEIDVTLGHTDPDELLEQIREEFKELIKVEWKCEVFNCVEHMVIYSRK